MRLLVSYGLNPSLFKMSGKSKKDDILDILDFDMLKIDEEVKNIRN